MGGYSGVGQLIPQNNPNYNNYSSDASGPNSGLNSNQSNWLYGPGATSPVTPTAPTNPYVPTTTVPQGTGVIPNVPMPGYTPVGQGTTPGSVVTGGISSILGNMSPLSSGFASPNQFGAPVDGFSQGGAPQWDVNAQPQENLSKRVDGGAGVYAQYPGDRGIMATSMAPLPSNYNPTGVGGVMGSNAGVENVANIQNFNPAVPVGSPPQVLGVGGAPSPFVPRVNATAPAPQNFQQPQSQFGYPTNIPIPNAANLNPATVGSGTGASVISPELQGALEKTYGAGFGQTLTNVLQQGAGYNPQVANAFIYAAQPYFESNMADLLEKFGISGQRFGSTAALAAGKMSADFTAQEQQTMAQMYQWAYGNFLSVLSKGQVNTSGNKFDTINSILGLGGDVAGLISEGFGVGGKTGQVLDALSKL